MSTADRHIAFNRPFESGNELAYIADTLKRAHISGDGAYTRRCTRMLETLAGSRRAMLTTSCTHALEMCALLLNIRPGDEVILPSYTFVSTANAFVLRGATPVFVDIRPDTLNIDEAAIEAAITPRTRAIVVVHYGGVGCEMDTITEICERRGVPLIEDNAHGIGASYRGRPLGSFGPLATLSFHETKNIHCGEGGALLINVPGLVERSEILREKGTNRSLFLRGEVDKYTWVDIGSSYLMSDLLAAYLWAQLESLEQIQDRRMHIWTAYREGLAWWAEGVGAKLPTVPLHCAHNAHLFYLLMSSQDQRDAFIRHMAERNINVPFHYVPLHRSPMAAHLSIPRGDCPITDSASSRVLRLPLYAGLTDGEVERVIEAATSFAAGP